MATEGPECSKWRYVLRSGGKAFPKCYGILHGGERYNAEIFEATMALRAVLDTRLNGEKKYKYS